MGLDRTWYNALVDDTGASDGTVISKSHFDALLDSIEAQLKPTITWSMPEGVSSPSPAAEFSALRGSWSVANYDGATQSEHRSFVGRLPLTYNSGGITVTLVICAVSATSGTSRWIAAFERMVPGTLDADVDDFATGQSAGVAMTAGSAGVFFEVTITFTNGQIDGLLAGELFRLKITRDPLGTTGTDDIGTDVSLVGVSMRET